MSAQGKLSIVASLTLIITSNVNAQANTPPTVSSVLAPDVGFLDFGTTSYAFDVTYIDDSAIDVSTILTSNVSVLGPFGLLTITSASEALGTDGTPRMATYTATPPGGSWDMTDVGAYDISVLVDQVGDDGLPQLYVRPDVIGTFHVTPEPSTLALVAFGFVVLAAWSWWRRR